MSHLLQMRGLKHNTSFRSLGSFPSHLLQMRGLKPLFVRKTNMMKKSHLLQMRGLKLCRRGVILIRSRRIFYRCVDWNPDEAWTVTGKTSRIFYRCVDWNIIANQFKHYVKVASFTDAWIETVSWLISLHGYQSHLLQMRGLKQKKICQKRYRNLSHLLQMRGLKHNPVSLHFHTPRRIFYRCVDWNTHMSISRSPFFVASFTDAWIETRSESFIDHLRGVASFTDAWIETHWVDQKMK